MKLKVLFFKRYINPSAIESFAFVLNSFEAEIYWKNLQLHMTKNIWFFDLSK